MDNFVFDVIFFVVVFLGTFGVFFFIDVRRRNSTARYRYERSRAWVSDVERQDVRIDQRTGVRTREIDGRNEQNVRDVPVVITWDEREG